MVAALLAALAIFPQFDLDVTYSKAGGEDLKLDIYRPAPGSNGAKSAAVLVIHGGAWMGGKRQDMAAMCQFLSGRGFLAATVEYRLAPKFKWPAMLDDCQTAVRYLRANADKLGIDANRIGAAGASAGGHLSLLLGFRDTRDPAPKEFPAFGSRVSAVVNLFGPTDLSNTTDFPPSLDMLFGAVLGKPRSQAAEEVRLASPVSFIDSKSAPVFTIQGKADTLVPYHQALLLDERLKATGVPHVLTLIEGMPHGLPLERKEVADAVEAAGKWLQEKLAAKTQTWAFAQLFHSGFERAQLPTGMPLTCVF